MSSLVYPMIVELVAPPIFTSFFCANYISLTTNLAYQVGDWSLNYDLSLDSDTLMYALYRL